MPSMESNRGENTTHKKAARKKARSKGKNQAEKAGPRNTHLHVVHFVLADHLDSDLAMVALQIAGAVDVAEGAVAHLLEQLPPLQAGVAGELCSARILLGNKLLELGLVDTSGL